MARFFVFNALISSECAAHCPDFINKDARPPNSPDLNPFDYHVWGWMLDNSNRLNPQPKNIPELKTALLMIWDELPQESYQKINRQLPQPSCINAKDVLRTL